MPVFLVEAPVSVHKAICHCFTYWYYQLSYKQGPTFGTPIGFGLNSMIKYFSADLKLYFNHLVLKNVWVFFKFSSPAIIPVLEQMIFRPFLADIKD